MSRDLAFLCVRSVIPDALVLKPTTIRVFIVSAISAQHNTRRCHRRLAWRLAVVLHSDYIPTGHSWLGESGLQECSAALNGDSRLGMDIVGGVR